MSLSLANSQTRVMDTIAEGLLSISKRQQAAIDNNDDLNVLALNGLRSKYVFDQMRINRSAISAIDGDPATTGLLEDLEAACNKLDSIHSSSVKVNMWIGSVSKGIDTVFGAFTKISSF